MKTITCAAAYASGGLGQHFTQVIEEARAEHLLQSYYASAIKSGDPNGRTVREPYYKILSEYTPVRLSPGWKNYLAGDLFDRAVAAVLTEPVDEIVCFGCQALRSFRKAKKLGAKNLHLVAANSHVENVQRLHRRAIIRNPIETSWLNQAQVDKTLKEYAAADVIHVASKYTWQTFVDAGCDESKLRRIHFTTGDRFKPPTAPMADGVFRVVYTGSVTVMKGVPLLIEAFSRLKTKNAELTLVGGWGTRSMKHHIQSHLAADPRIKLSPGDPLPHLHRANAYVHPSWEDGWAYSAAEAVACGVPTIVTEDTGMKELIKDGKNGYIVPTGNVDAIYERLELLSKAL